MSKDILPFRTGSCVNILIVSSNPLFEEVILEAVANFSSEITRLDPDQAINRVGELKPDVIIIDETIIKSRFEILLTATRSSQKTRTIVVNPKQNEVLLVDSRRTELRKAEELSQVITSYQNEISTNKKVRVE